MPTVAEIADLAFDAVDDAIPDAIHAATLSYDVSVSPNSPNTAYDTATGEYLTTAGTATGRAVVETSKPLSDVFPDYVAGSGDELILLEGFTTCKEGWKLTFNSTTWHIKQVQDILAAGSLFYVIGWEVKA